jgi:hypothetical protein
VNAAGTAYRKGDQFTCDACGEVHATAYGVGLLLPPGGQTLLGEALTLRQFLLDWYTDEERSAARLEIVRPEYRLPVLHASEHVS